MFSGGVMQLPSSLIDLRTGGIRAHVLVKEKAMDLRMQGCFEVSETPAHGGAASCLVSRAKFLESTVVSRRRMAGVQSM